MRRRIPILILCLLSLLFLGAGCVTTTISVNTDGKVQGAETTTPETFHVSLRITDDEGRARVYERSAVPGTSALDLFNTLQNDGELAYESTTFDFGVLIERINGLAADANHFWGFYTNDDMANVGVGEYLLLADDRIELRYQAIE
jgi:hypothetical protein